MNRAGFSPEQQKKLENAIKLAQYAAGVVTLMHQSTYRASELTDLVITLHNFAVEVYPSGPMELAADLNEISTFCDLSIITTPIDLDTGEPM